MGAALLPAVVGVVAFGEYNQDRPSVRLSLRSRTKCTAINWPRDRGHDKREL